MRDKNKLNITIVGLGVVGTSLGLALKAATSGIPVIGHDPDAQRVARARKLGAVDKSHWNLISACEKADLILLDLPMDTIERTLMALQHELKEGATIIDTCPMKRPVIEWATRILPETVQFVGGHVVLRRSSIGLTEPSAELLKGATFYLVVPEGTSPEAFDLASNLAATVGATPQYIDPLEHDGLVAATHQLPLVAALAIVSAVKEGPGSRDRTKLVEDLSAIAAVIANVPAANSEGILANADNLLRWLDIYVLELTKLRRLISEGDGSNLDALLTKAQETCLQWLRHEEPDHSSAIERDRSSTWRNLFLGGLGRRGPR